MTKSVALLPTAAILALLAVYAHQARTYCATALLPFRICTGLRLLVTGTVAAQVDATHAMDQLEQMSKLLAPIWFVAPTMWLLEVFFSAEYAEAWPTALAWDTLFVAVLVLHPKIQRPIFEVRWWGAVPSLAAEVTRKLYAAHILYVAHSLGSHALLLLWAAQVLLFMFGFIAMQPHIGPRSMPRIYANLRGHRFVWGIFIITIASEIWATHLLSLATRVPAS